MKKEYVTARLFKNNRALDDLTTNREFRDSQLRQTTNTCDIAEEDSNETCESDPTPAQTDLPSKLHNVIQKASDLLGLSRRD